MFSGKKNPALAADQAVTIGPLSGTVVPARSSLTVPYTLAVPADAEPGDHPGAVVALDERVEAAGAGSVAVGVQRAVGARV